MTFYVLGLSLTPRCIVGRDKFFMGVARNAFHGGTQAMGNVLVVPDTFLTRFAACWEKTKQDSAPKYQPWQHRAVSACAGLHMGAPAQVHSDLCQPPHFLQGGGMRSSISAMNNLIKACRGKLLFYSFLLLYSPIWSDSQRDELNQASRSVHSSVLTNSLYLQIQNFIWISCLL